MDTNEIKEAGITSLELRLAIVDYSTIARQAQEAAAIKAEIARRRAAHLSSLPEPTLLNPPPTPTGASRIRGGECR